jgi:Ser/Thr protein kinase RdoA (MazF antagonist)
MPDPEASHFVAIARAATRRHGFSDAATLTPYGLTENPTFRVEEPGPRPPLVLRIYRPHGRPLVEIRSELAWIAALRAETQVPVAAAVPTLAGEPVCELTGHDGAAASVAACEWAPGSEPDPESLGALMPQLGAFAAGLHAHARRWRRPDWFTRPRWDLSTTIGDGPHWGPWQRGVPDAGERAQLERLARAVEARLLRFGDGPERFGLVHADLRTANIVADGKRLSVIDFDDCGDSWYLYELAGTLTFSETRADIDDLVSAWVDGYRTVRPLADDDVEEIPTFLMLRRLLLSAYIGLRPETELAAELHRDGFNAATCELAERYLTGWARDRRPIS